MVSYKIYINNEIGYYNIDIDEKTEIHMNNIFNDINSNKSYSEKKYLQEFDKRHECYKSLSNSCNLNDHNRINFHQNYYGTNNVNILGINNYNGGIRSAKVF